MNRPKQDAICGGCPHYIAVSPIEGECHGHVPSATPLMAPAMIPGGPPTLMGVVSVWPRFEAVATGCWKHPDWKQGMEFVIASGGGDA
jgi:hypothetical protein